MRFENPCKVTKTVYYGWGDGGYRTSSSS